MQSPDEVRSDTASRRRSRRNDTEKEREEHSVGSQRDQGTSDWTESHGQALCGHQGAGTKIKKINYYF